jgi:hypothetical protein
MAAARGVPCSETGHRHVSFLQEGCGGAALSVITDNSVSGMCSLCQNELMNGFEALPMTGGRCYSLDPDAQACAAA